MPAARIAGGLAVLVAVSLVLRSTALGAGYWIDEGLSVGIASHPLTEIPGLLQQDGSPPLYYLLLHAWMEVFGDGEPATHALSLVLALGTIPVAWWAGRLVDGERCGWIAAALAATNGFLTYYAQETRMYTLLALLSLVVAALAIRGFAHRDRRALPWLAVTLAAVALTHSWGVFLVAATAVTATATGLRSVSRESRRRRLLDVLLVSLGATALYAVWLPTLIFQAAHTGAPWSQTPGLRDLADTLAGAVGGTGPAAVLLGVAVALAVLWLVRRRERAVTGEGRGPLRDQGAAIVLLAGSGLGAVVIAFGASQVEPAWAGRYAAVAVGPLLLLAALVLGRAGTPGIAALAVVCVLGLADPRTGALERKDNVRAVAGALRTAGVDDGDVVVSAHPERGPVLRHYLGGGPRYADLLGPVAEPRVFDWRDALERLERSEPARVADALVASIRPGGRLALVVPELRAGRWTAPWTRLVRARTPVWERLLAADPRLRRLGAIPAAAPTPRPRTVRAVVFRRVG